MTKIVSKIRLVKEPHVRFKIKFTFNIMRMMHTKGWDSSPVEKQYWEELGWLSKLRPWKKNKNISF